MRIFILLLTFIAPSSSLFGQSELAKRNGFKDIKLGSSIDSVKGAILIKEFIESKEFQAKLYEVEHSDYQRIGSVAVKHIELKTYHGFIYEITVSTAKDPQVMKALEKSYGKAIYSVRDERFYWRATDTLSLVYKGHPKKIELSYRSVPIRKKMFVDKGKKIEQIADDF
jgi:hypothetical protein